MKRKLDIKIDENNKRAYRIWNSIYSRAYSKYYIKRSPTYKGCSVSEKWKLFSNFNKWYNENYIEGYQLDKDILVQGNKIYGPEFCCFVPSQINSLFTKRDGARGKCVLGVQAIQRKDLNHISYRAVISNHLTKKPIQYDFRNEKDAYECYVKMKLQYIKDVAEYYKDRIKINVYNALLNYKYDSYENEKSKFVAPI